MRRSYTSVDELSIGVLANPNVLDRLIEWKLNSPREMKLRRKTTTWEHKMQRQFTIELRVDYADNEKNAVMKEALQQCARHAYATATLLTDGVKAQVAIFSDDYFSGHEEIMLLSDTIQQGLDTLGGDQKPETVSNELLEAVKDGA